MNRIHVLGICGSVLAGAIAFSAAAIAEPRGEGRDGARAPRHGRMHQRLAARRLLKDLNLTDAQKAGIKESREATEAPRADLRARVRAIVQEARSGERTKDSRKAAREKIRAAIEAAVGCVQPQAQKVLDSLTADQKAMIVRAVATHGRSTDDASLVKGLSRLFLRGGRPHRAGR